MADEQTRGGDQRSFTLWILSAVFLAAVIIAAIAVVVINSNNNRGNQPPPTTPVTNGVPTGPSSAPPPSQAGGTGCTIAQTSNTNVPQETPPGIEWRSTSYGVVLPYSATDGPTIENGPIAECYSHTPTGALMAMSQILPRVTANPILAERNAIMEAQFTGPRKAEVIQSMQNAGFPIRWRAFRVATYSPEKAIIFAVQELNPGQPVGSNFTMVWEDNTWKMDAASLKVQFVSVSDLTGYIPWSAGA